MDEILEITPLPFPYDLDAKIFLATDDEGNVLGETFSYNEWIQDIKNMAGVSEELLGACKNL